MFMWPGQAWEAVRDGKFHFPRPPRSHDALMRPASTTKADPGRNMGAWPRTCPQSSKMAGMRISNMQFHFAAESTNNVCHRQVRDSITRLRPPRRPNARHNHTQNTQDRTIYSAQIMCGCCHKIRARILQPKKSGGRGRLCCKPASKITTEHCKWHTVFIVPWKDDAGGSKGSTLSSITNVNQHKKRKANEKALEDEVELKNSKFGMECRHGKPYARARHRCQCRSNTKIMYSYVK